MSSEPTYVCVYLILWLRPACQLRSYTFLLFSYLSPYPYLPAAAFSLRALISGGQEMKLHCPVTRSRREGDLGRVRGRGSLRKKKTLVFFLDGDEKIDSLRMWFWDWDGSGWEERNLGGLRTILRQENIFTEADQWQQIKWSVSLITLDSLSANYMQQTRVKNMDSH